MTEGVAVCYVEATMVSSTIKGSVGGVVYRGGYLRGRAVSGLPDLISGPLTGAAVLLMAGPSGVRCGWPRGKRA